MKKNVTQYTFEEVIKQLRSRFRPTVVWEWGVLGFFLGFFLILVVTFLVYRYYVSSDATKMTPQSIPEQTTTTFHQEELDDVLEILEERRAVRPVATVNEENIDQ